MVFISREALSPKMDFRNLLIFILLLCFLILFCYELLVGVELSHRPRGRTRELLSYSL